MKFYNFWKTNFNRLKISALDKRMVTPIDLEEVFVEYQEIIQPVVIGESALGRPLWKLILGSGRKNVIAWSAMHGNESTSLRGWMDLFVNQQNPEVEYAFRDVLKEFTIHFIPMLNPDGAMQYTRRNAMDIDMNRDARAAVSPEIKALYKQIDTLNPVLAFNLHDQRNIFSVGDKPATLSFLAPSVDWARSTNAVRKKAMDLIGAAVNAVSPLMSGGIGRYTDEFYPTALGERVQEMNIPTILVECGAALKDPLRQEPRMLNAVILHAVLSRLSVDNEMDASTYLNIPINEKNQVDILFKGAKIKRGNVVFEADVAVLEELRKRNGELTARYRFQDLGDLSHLIGLQCFECASSGFTKVNQVGELANFSIETTEGLFSFKNGVLTHKKSN